MTAAAGHGRNAAWHRDQAFQVTKASLVAISTASALSAGRATWSVNSCCDCTPRPQTVWDSLCRDKPPLPSTGEKQAALYNLACCYSKVLSAVAEVF